MLQSYALLIIAVVLTVGAQMMLKSGMNQIGEIDFSLAGIGRLIVQASTNLYIIGALASLAVGFILWLVVLSKVKLSVAVPFTALNFILVLFFSWLFLKESITAVQLAGVFLIIGGLFLVAR